MKNKKENSATNVRGTAYVVGESKPFAKNGVKSTKVTGKDLRVKGGK